MKNKLKVYGIATRKFLWRRQTLYSVLLIGLLIGIVFLLSNIPTHSAPEEVSLVRSSQSLRSISENPLSLPYKAASYVVGIVFDSVRFHRAISIVFFGLCVVALYRILKRWHSEKIALLATALFATNAVTLSVARLATPVVLLLGWSILISVLLWMQHGNSRRVAPLVLAGISAGLLYVPGAPYFFVLLCILFFSKLKALLMRTKRMTLVIAGTAVLLACTPLIISFIQDVQVLKEWLLLPETIVWSQVPRNILRIPSAFIYRMPIEPLINVGRLPIFDVASGGLFLIGLYAYQQNIRLERTKVMIATGILSIILGALGQLIAAIVILLPFVAAIIAAGISYLLGEWYRVFPRNPVARSFGLMLITLVVTASMFYQLTRFMVVWPQTPETRATYNQSRIIRR